MTETTVTLSPNAARRIHAIGQTEGHPVMLRVAVGLRVVRVRWSTLHDRDLRMSGV